EAVEAGGGAYEVANGAGHLVSGVIGDLVRTGCELGNCLTQVSGSVSLAGCGTTRGLCGSLDVRRLRRCLCGVSIVGAVIARGLRHAIRLPLGCGTAPG